MSGGDIDNWEPVTDVHAPSQEPEAPLEEDPLSVSWEAINTDHSDEIEKNTDLYLKNESNSSKDILPLKIDTTFPEVPSSYSPKGKTTLPRSTRTVFDSPVSTDLRATTNDSQLYGIGLLPGKTVAPTYSSKGSANVSTNVSTSNSSRNSVDGTTDLQSYRNSIEKGNPPSFSNSKVVNVGDLEFVGSDSNPSSHRGSVSHDDQDKPSDTPSSPSFFSSLMSSMSVPRDLSSKETKQEIPNSPMSPSIISHRRQPSGSMKKSNKRHSSSGSVSSFISPLQEVGKPAELSEKVIEEDKESKLFSGEKYMDTEFHYASNERNAEFHNTFIKVPENDRLLDDFICTLSSEFLFQGRLYISEAHICFNSTILGWFSKVVIPFKEVTFLDKTSPGGLFPNAISIETSGGKTQFNGFVSRDATFDLIKEIWARVLLEENDKQSEKELKTAKTDFSVSDKSYKNPKSIKSNEYVVHDIIASDDSSIYHGNDILSSSSSNEKANLSEKSISDAATHERTVYELSPDSKYEYNGPYLANETKFPFVPEDNGEYLLAEVELNAPPGVVFQLMFSDTNPSFWLKFSEIQDTSAFSAIPEFNKVNSEGQRYREYEHLKALNYAVGPSSTKCLVDDTILHCDYENYMNVVNTTRTPDVPSGGSFSTKTRYLFRWASETTCMLKLSFWVEWTGTSWIKSIVESSCKNGQIAVAESMIPFIKEYIEAHTDSLPFNVSDHRPVNVTEATTTQGEVTETESEIYTQPTIKASEKPKTATTALEYSSKDLLFISLFTALIALLLANLYGQMKIMNHIGTASSLSQEMNIENIKLMKQLTEQLARMNL